MYGRIIALAVALVLLAGAVYGIASVTTISGKAEFHISFNEKNQTPEQAAQVALEALTLPIPQHKPARAK